MPKRPQFEGDEFADVNVGDTTLIGAVANGTLVGDVLVGVVFTRTSVGSSVSKFIAEVGTVLGVGTTGRIGQQHLSMLYHPH